MPKNIVICCDGTHNQFGSNNTNVVRLVQELNFLSLTESKAANRDLWPM